MSQPTRNTALLLGMAQLLIASGLSAATFAVNDFGDGADDDLNDPICATQSGSCTLRAAIEQANFTAGADTVEFAVNGTVLLEVNTIDIEESLILRAGTATTVTISSTNAGQMLRILGNGTAVTIQDLRFSNPAGKAIAIGTGPQVLVERCVFEGNVGGGGLTRNGGAITVDGETTIIDSEFRDNDGTRGGAIDVGNGALLTVRDTLIEDNTSTGNGGAISVGSGSERLVLENVVLRGNVAAGNGGAIYSQSRVETAGVSIHDNEAGGDGGGVWSQNQVGGNTIVALELVGADVRGNEATGNGGGLYLATGVGLHTFLVSRSAIWENDASDGGGIYAFGSSDTEYTIANSTIGLNTSGSAGGIRLVLGDLDILHSTIWENENEQIASGGPGKSLARLGNSIVGFDAVGQTSCDNAPTQLGPNLASDGACGASIVGDPQLRPIQNTGGPAPTQPFEISSPALDAADAGICSASPIEYFDSDGPNRPFGAACDLGSWESRGVLFEDGFESGGLTRWSASVG